MHECYFCYYIFNSNHKKPETVIDQGFLKDIEIELKKLPEYEPSDIAIKKLLQYL